MYVKMKEIINIGITELILILENNNLGILYSTKSLNYELINSLRII